MDLGQIIFLVLGAAFMLIVGYVVGKGGRL